MRKPSLERFSTILRNGKAVYGDGDRKALHHIMKEFLVASLRSKSVATYYFTSLLYKKDVNYLNYVSHKEWKRLQRVICDTETYIILGDKLYFHNYFERFGLPMPELRAYSIRERVAVKHTDDWISQEITTVDSLQSFIAVLLQSSGSNSIFIKPTVSSGGHGIMRINGHSREVSQTELSSLFSKVIKGAYIYQDEVSQHPDLSIINANTLNTIRIDTFKAPGRKPEIISAYLRIGRSKDWVDNLAAGGFRVGIDVEKGKLRRIATSNLSHGGSFITHHPDSGVKFEDFIVPFFSDVKSLAIEAADCLPKSLIGWDIAVSERGPVLIEGNTVYYAMSGADVAYGGYKTNAVYARVADYIKNNLDNAADVLVEMRRRLR